jgi:hypothetical protein
VPSNCKICKSCFKDTLDKQIGDCIPFDDIIESIKKRIRRTLAIHKDVEARYAFKRSRNVVTEQDKHELSWINKEVDKKVHLIDITIDDLKSHEEHMSYCSHLHTSRDKCSILCKHVSRHDPEIVIDGVVVLKDVIEYSDIDLSEEL